eukprot:198554-Prymnesium_polylepis.2
MPQQCRSGAACGQHRRKVAPARHHLRLYRSLGLSEVERREGLWLVVGELPHIDARAASLALAPLVPLLLLLGVRLLGLLPVCAASFSLVIAATLVFCTSSHSSHLPTRFSYICCVFDAFSACALRLITAVSKGWAPC